VSPIGTLNRRFALLLVLVVAAALRLVDLSHAPVALNQDEAVNGYDAYSIAYTLRDHHGNFLPPVMQSFNDYASPFTTYVTVPFVRLLGLSELSIRLPPALFGVASVLLMVLFLERIGCGWGASMVGGLLLALSPWDVTYTRWAVPTCAVPLVLLCLMYAAVQLFDGPPRATWRRALLVGLAGGLLTYTYPAQKVFAPLVVGLTALVYLWPRRDPSAEARWPRRVIDVLLMVAVLTVFLLPHLFQQLTNPAKYAWHARNVLLVGHTEHLLSDVATRYADYFSFDFFFGAGDPNVLQHVPGPASFVTLGPLAILGLVACVLPSVRRAWLGDPFVKGGRAALGARSLPGDPSLDGRVGIWLTGLALIAPLPAAITIERMHSARAIQLLVLMTVLMVIGMHELVMWLPPGLRARNLRILAFTVVVVLASAEAWRFTRFYFGEYRELSKPDFQYGIKQALQMVEPLRCRRVLVDARINQPYIYYLFYARYPPRLLDYGAINENIGRRIGWLVVTEIGRYQFVNLPPPEIAAAHKLGDVNDGRRIWYTILRNAQSETCIVQKRD
jgi:4-amino-4-deoxy-L-arabinose transferase-like glycosyltransferase